MARDMFGDRYGFAEARRDFLLKRRPAATPIRLATHRENDAECAA
jgi:putative two-component system protein, hydrogenase maturation factor HypX/HoxX